MAANDRDEPVVLVATSGASKSNMMATIQAAAAAGHVSGFILESTGIDGRPAPALPNGMTPTEFFSLEQECFLNKLGSTMNRIIRTDGMRTPIRAVATDYVIPGYIYMAAAGHATLRFWVGINGSRLFYIAAIEDMDAAKARQTFAFCFGGAAKVGWDFCYEEAELRGNKVVSIWGTCMTNETSDVFAQVGDQAPAEHGSQNQALRPSHMVLTRHGQFWVTDVAMMAQSFIRVCERFGVRTSDAVMPQPL